MFVKIILTQFDNEGESAVELLQRTLARAENAAKSDKLDKSDKDRDQTETVAGVKLVLGQVNICIVTWHNKGFSASMIIIEQDDITG